MSPISINYKAVLFYLCIICTNAIQAQTIPSNTDESKVPTYILPNALQNNKGKQVQSTKEWENFQRPFIYHLYEKIQFGRYPDKAASVSFRIMERNSQALEGLATRKQVRIFLHPADTTVYVDLLIYFPNAAKQPVPVFLGYNFFGNQAIQNDKEILLTNHWVQTKTKGASNNRVTDSSRGIEASQWDVKEILNHGYAVATAYCGDLEPDNPDGWKSGIRTTLRDVLQIQPEEWTCMGAWAYGLGRIYDYFLLDKQINPGKVALLGHSRLGKAALWAAASDKRFALIVSNESGEGGATLSKRWYGETVKIITDKFPHWFMPQYKAYGDSVGQLPIDGHMLLSMIAPRPLYVASAEGDTWSDPKGEFLSAKEAGKVYALYGKKGIEETVMPGLHQPVGNTIRYHIRAGKHDVTKYDWQQYLLFADTQWK
ncbi:MAG: hypothetical protein RLZZ28_270 [Bacteroidota bacterium]